MTTASATKIRPLADRVVVRPLEDTEQMRGGLYIPDTAKEKPQQGEVVAVGPGKRTDKGERLPIDVQVGDRVLYKKWAGGDTIRVGDDELLILAEADIVGVIED